MISVRTLADANPNTTLSTYAHMFDRADHAAAAAKEALEAGHETITNGRSW